MAESTDGVLSEKDRSAIASALKFGGSISFVLLGVGLLTRTPGWALHHQRIGMLLIHAGIIALLSTPVLRILCAIWLYWRLGDRRLAGVCLFSLLVIGCSVAVGLMLPKK